jgi:hypothetical protein
LELLADVPGGRELHREWRHLHIRGEWFEADEELLRYIAELAGGGPAPEPDLRARAQAAQFRRVLSALDPAGLADGVSKIHPDTCSEDEPFRSVYHCRLTGPVA